MYSPGTWLSLYEQQETRSLAKLSSSLPWVEKCHLGKMNDRWVISIYEVENAHTHPPPCLAVIEVCFVCRSLCEVNKGVKGKGKSEARSTMVRFLAVIFSSPSHVTLKGPTPAPPFIRLESQPPRPLYNVAGVSLGERSDGVRPLWHRLLWSSLKSNGKERIRTALQTDTNYCGAFQSDWTLRSSDQRATVLS